jgi:hypothetical protein
MQQALLDEGVELAHGGGEGGSAGVPRYGLRRRQRKAAGKDGQTPKERARLLREEGSGPLNRGRDRLLPDRRITRAIAEQLEPIRHLRQEGFGGEDRHACRRQFDGQRQTVEGSAEGCDRLGVGCRQGEARANGLRPLDEEAHSIVLRNGPSL